MFSVFRLALVAMVLNQLPGTAASAEIRGEPIGGWRTGTPEEAGLDSEALASLFRFVRENRTPVHSLQIVRRGMLLVDAYFYPFTDGARHDVASVTKSITSTLVGSAIAEGKIKDVSESIFSFYPEGSHAQVDMRTNALTLEHLLTMQAGWDCGFEAGETRLTEMRRSRDWIQFMLSLPMVADPGTRWAYCSGNCHLLSAIITRVTGTNALEFARRKLFAPLGIKDVAWPADPWGNNHGWGDLQMHPRDMAKIGQLMLQRGRFDGQEVLPANWVAEATRAHAMRTSNADRYGYFWWVKGEGLPGMFEAVGRGGQRITVWPAEELVVVFTGGGFEPGDLGNFILAALKSKSSLPANREAFDKLQREIVSAARSPSPTPPGKLPAMAARISGKTFTLSTNALRMQSISLSFNDSAGGTAEVGMEGRRIFLPFGLNGLTRSSTNMLGSFRVASKGEWKTADTFFLEHDSVAGINCYQLTLSFSASGRSARISCTERTGLLDEMFTGEER